MQSGITGKLVVLQYYNLPDIHKFLQNNFFTRAEVREAERAGQLRSPVLLLRSPAAWRLPASRGEKAVEFVSRGAGLQILRPVPPKAATAVVVALRRRDRTRETNSPPSADAGADAGRRRCWEFLVLTN